jgi:hypothetical protein
VKKVINFPTRNIELISQRVLYAQPVSISERIPENTDLSFFENDKEICTTMNRIKVLAFKSLYQEFQLLFQLFHQDQRALS